MFALPFLQGVGGYLLRFYLPSLKGGSVFAVLTFLLSDDYDEYTYLTVLFIVGPMRNKS